LPSRFRFDLFILLSLPRRRQAMWTGPGPGPGAPQRDALMHRKELLCLDFGPSNASAQLEFCSTAFARLVAGSITPSGLNISTSRLIITPFRIAVEKSSLQRSVGHVALSSMVPSRAQVKLVPACEPSKLVSTSPSKSGNQQPVILNASPVFKPTAVAQASNNTSVLTTPIRTNVVVLLGSSPAVFAALSSTRKSELFFGSLLWYGCTSSLPLLPTHSCSSALYCQLFGSTFITYLLLVQSVCKWKATSVMACGTFGVVVVCSLGALKHSVAVVMPSFTTRMLCMLLLASLLFLSRFCVSSSGSQPVLRVRL